MNPFQNIYDAQKAYFGTGVTRGYEWRVEQLDRMARMIKENEGRFQEAIAKDFKTASQEYIFETAASAGETEVQKSQLKEWMKPVEAPVPIAGLMTRIGGIAPLLGSCRCPIRVHRPLLNCPRLTLDRRFFLSVRPWVVTG